MSHVIQSVRLALVYSFLTVCYQQIPSKDQKQRVGSAVNIGGLLYHVNPKLVCFY